MSGSSSIDELALAGPEKSARIEIGLIAGLMLVAVLASLIQLGQTPGVWVGEQVRFIAADSPEFALPSHDDGNWTLRPVNEIGSFTRISWIRTEVELKLGQLPIPPYAIFLSGPFSAEVFWDGQALGTKGQVGVSRDQETPGPIDSVFHIPDALSTPGKYLLALRISTTHLGYQADMLIHKLAVGRFQSDPRRQLRYSALPLILSGGFLLLALQFARICWATGSSSALTLTAFTVFILVQLGSEISRSLTAYSYDWHLMRSLCIWLFAVLSGLSLNLLVLLRLRHRLSLLWLIAMILGVSIFSYLTSGFDSKTIIAIKILAVGPVIAGLISVREAKPDLVLVAAGFLCVAWYVIAGISETMLLDSGYYFTTIVFLSVVGLWLSQGKQSVDGERPTAVQANYFFIKQTGRVVRVATSKVLLLKACGNYTELICEDDRTLLHHQRLGQIMEHRPRGFLRVHRSHAINLDKVQGLRSREGSRYFAELAGGLSVSVSRYRVKEVRAFLQAGA